jgi:hypothetical protein
MAIIAGLLIFSFIHGSKKDKQEEKEKLKDD